MARAAPAQASSDSQGEERTSASGKGKADESEYYGIQVKSKRIVYVIDVSGGEKIPRKGGPGITRSDLLVINKTDLAPYVGASLEVMDVDTKRMRRDLPYQFTSLRHGEGVEAIVEFIVHHGLLDAAA